MKTDDSAHSLFFSVAPSRAEVGIRNDEVVGSIPTSSTNLPREVPRCARDFAGGLTSAKRLKFEPTSSTASLTSHPLRSGSKPSRNTSAGCPLGSRMTVSAITGPRVHPCCNERPGGAETTCHCDPGSHRRLPVVRLALERLKNRRGR